MSEIQKPPIIVDLGDGITMTFRHIPAGRFRMGQRGGEGNEEPVTEVEVDEFWMGETPVTQEQFGAMDVGSMLFIRGWTPSYFHGGRRPVEQVEIRDIELVSAWLTRRVREVVGEGWCARIPSEEEWEYACLAGDECREDRWSDPSALAEIAWFADNSSDETHDVALLQPNAWGIHDMLGNVWEYCSNQWNPGYYRLLLPGKTAREAVSTFECHALRGGSFDRPARYCRGRFRIGDVRSYSGIGPAGRSMGFRLCLFPSALEIGQRQEAVPASGTPKRRIDPMHAESDMAWDETRLPSRTDSKFPDNS